MVGRGPGRLIDVEAIKVNGIDERICGNKNGYVREKV